MPGENENSGSAQAGATGATQTGITQEQVHAAAEKARLEERTKLRGEIEAANTKVTTLNGQVEQLTTANQKLTNDLAALKASMKPEGGIDVEKLVDQIVARTNSEWQQKFDKLSGELETERNTRQKLTVEQLRARLIQQAGGEDSLISALVVGSSETELLASIEVSKAEYQKIAKRVGGGNTSSQQTSNENGSGKPGATAAAAAAMPLPGQTGGAGAIQAKIGARTLNRAEYAQQRDTLRKNAAARYPANYVTQ